jgi:hypothetical protein
MVEDKVSDLMLEGVIAELSPETAAADARERIMESQIILVRAPISIPQGILTRKAYFRLQGIQGPINAIHGLLAGVGVTTPNTPLVEIVESVAFDRAINWFVAMEGNQPVGYITPRLLFQLLKTNAKYGQAFVKPNPTPPSALCYCCPPAATHAAHMVSPAIAAQNEDPSTGLSMCPTHKSSQLVLKIPCVGC